MGKINAVFTGSLLTGLLCFTLISQAIPQHTANQEVVEAKQNRWIKKAVRQLKNDFGTMNCDNPIDPSVVDIEGLYLKAYRLNGPEGCIYFPNGDWILMISHSMHDDPAIGDVTLAIDRRQQIFINKGHVCGGIINFYIDAETEIISSQDFFKHFMSDCDDCKWNKLN
jgi:hypothetical protein